MNIIEGQNVDLISPFPQNKVEFIFGWNHACHTVAETDDTPNTLETFVPHMAGLIDVCPSWGLVDKNRLTKFNHEAPLVGIILFEPVTIRHGFLHIASPRRAWKSGLIEEAAKLVIDELFTKIPTLLRVGAYMWDKNNLAKGLVKRLGFGFEGCVRDMILKYGKPEDMAYFGLTKRSYLCQLEQQQSPSSVQLEEPGLAPLEVEEIKEEVPQVQIV